MSKIFKKLSILVFILTCMNCFSGEIQVAYIDKEELFCRAELIMEDGNKKFVNPLKPYSSNIVMPDGCEKPDENESRRRIKINLK